MISLGRMGLITFVALAAGFVGGVWFIGSGLGFRWVPVPTLAPAGAVTSQRPASARPAPRVKAVAVPRPANFNGGSAGLGQRADRADLAPSPGCHWVIEPRPFRLGDEWLSGDPERFLVGYSAVDPATGGLRYLLVQSARQGGSAIDLRPVFFDEEANRQVPRNIGRSASGAECITGEYALDPARQLTPEKVAYFGVERVVPDADRLLVEAAQQEAKEKGMAILPPPRVGEPYPFDLPAIDGKRLRSGDLRGKVVLVAVGGPDGSSVAHLKWVKRVKEANPTDEIAIVGVSFDGSAEDARATFADSGAEDRLVVVPNDPKARRIWREGAEIAHVPTFFLIDREGVLRFTCRSFELQDRVDILFGRARRGPLLKPTRIARPARKAPTVPARGREASPTQRPGA